MEKIMKKIVLALTVAATMFAAVPAVHAENARTPGGFTAGLIGCCFGMRTAAAWNEGKSLGIRDILDLIFIGRIWSAITATGGTTTSDLHKEAPAYY